MLEHPLNCANLGGPILYIIYVKLRRDEVSLKCPYFILKLLTYNYANLE